MTLLTLCVGIALHAQEPFAGTARSCETRAAAREERHRLNSKEDNLFVTVSTGLTAFNQIVAGVKLEYSRQLKGRFYWGTTFSARWHLGRFYSYDWDGIGRNPYDNSVAQNIYKLDAMAYYRLPVVRSRLFLRFGAGAGVGYHHMTRHADDAKDMDKDKVLPYLNVECAWILRVSKDFELKFSPTILFAPSEFSVSPMKLGAPTDVTPWLMDAGFSLTCGWRF